MAPLPARLADVERAHAMFAPIADAPHEVAVFAYLDATGMLLAMRHSPAGDAASVPVPLRRLAADALAFDAAAMVMAHNHPSGDPRPSASDIAVTRLIDRALAAIEVRLVDHLIVTRGRVTSFRILGLL
ncbi:JAB domain-containing protein [Sphingomonas baiyangensis]|uniref:DNA repair protein n=1 Tax=Sphingomonas baiyangensis TaxID=2572576 RepID=A0A4U1L4B9_9SPHN|nr:JAB domain-containing protein [Sphingomonas baiyangensis]TKD51006.1 DNA repair protein [Sphingomonas baiyangensis]